MNNGREVLSKNLKKLIDKKGIDQRILADYLGISEMSVSNWVNGIKYPRMGNVQKMADYFGVMKSDIIEEKDDIKTFTSSQYNYYAEHVSAGIPDHVDAITDADKISLPDSIMGKWAGNKNIYITRINGDSMDKVIPDNSLIAVKPVNLPELKNGDMVVFSNNHEYSVKYYKKIDDKLVFSPHSTNDDHYDQMYDVDDNIVIHGKVVLYIVEMD